MKRSVALGIVGLSVVVGVGAAYAVDAATETPSVPHTAPARLGSIVPGAFEPVNAEMTIAEAEKTGFIEPDPERNEMCQGDFFRWTGAGTDGLDVITADGRIASLGMRTAALKTADGLTVGSTYADVRAAFPDQMIEMTSDYGQPGVLIDDQERWLGFLFGSTTPETLKPTSKVTFIEVSEGDRPGLLRDGC